MPQYAIGLDFGTNSARCLVVRIDEGEVVAHAVFPYPSGEDGILLDDREPELARQHPKDYVEALRYLLTQGVLEARSRDEDFHPERVVGIGVDATASTPMPLNASGVPLALEDAFSEDFSAMAWLWKDHTSHAEAGEITERARRERPFYLGKCGGSYSSEWFWAKLLRCARTSPKVFESAFTWMELCDWIPQTLTGFRNPVRGICSAAHKALYHPEWGGYPDEEFLQGLHPGLARVRRTLQGEVRSVAHSVGGLSREWAELTGLKEGTAVAVGAIDAHMGAVGAGVREGTLVKILGTSTCDMAVSPLERPLPEIPGIAGIAPESILPGHYGLEAGQSAVGDLFYWFTERMLAGDHQELMERASRLKPGESGLLALDWNNGNRNVLADPRLTGLLVGQTLSTRPFEVYRALIEATAFGALTILRRLEEYGVMIEEIVTCGGIAEKNPLLLQIYADVTGKVLKVSRSPETCALGAAMCGSVVGGAFSSYDEARERLTGVRDKAYYPDADNHRVYARLYELYQTLHDAFGTSGTRHDLYPVMKELLRIRDEARKGGA
jgi:L-ribulokinase